VKTAARPQVLEGPRPSGRELGAIVVPIPGQELVELLDVVIVDAREYVGEPGLRIDVVEPRGLDQRVHYSGALAAAIGAGEQPRLASERNLSVILPISGRRWKSIIGGTRSLGVVSGFAAASNVILAALPTSRRRPAW
jgi:hypothetical protein